MASYVGFDGFRGGWVAASISDDGSQYFDYSPNLSRLISGDIRRAMIDIPIGLPEAGYRRCDREARAIVGSSVFLGARRNLLRFSDFAEANEFYWANEGVGWGISRQLWHIRDKIREIDEFITPERQKWFCETHPEVVFAKRSKEELDSKHSDKGRNQRVRILEASGFTKITHWLSLRFGTRIGRDDLVDACACAVAARDAESVLGGDERDGRQLRMQINL